MMKVFACTTEYFYETFVSHQHTTSFVSRGANLRKTNDPKLLKNALKRKAKKKAASAKAWNVRLDQAKDAATKKQHIRSHNIDARKVGGATGANLSSKRIVEQNQDGTGGEGGPSGGGGNKEKRRRMGPHSGQGQNRAGFEGRKSGFINGGGKEANKGGGTKG
jgi:DNA excision repair protein ERCC-4